MKKQFSKELEEEKKKVRNSNEVEVEGKKGIKRRSEEESQEAEESESQASRITPSTPPSAKRFAAESSDTTTPLANNVPTYKPTPIVGQPRKSPSPERKRPASSNKVPKLLLECSIQLQGQGMVVDLVELKWQLYRRIEY